MCIGGPEIYGLRRRQKEWFLLFAGMAWKRLTSGNSDNQ